MGEMTQGKELLGPLRVEISPQLTVSKETGISAPQLQEN
jgi:hypothetical protein